jgi:hypothetical protein
VGIQLVDALVFSVLIWCSRIALLLGWQRKLADRADQVVCRKLALDAEEMLDSCANLGTFSVATLGGIAWRTIAITLFVDMSVKSVSGERFLDGRCEVRRIGPKIVARVPLVEQLVEHLRVVDRRIGNTERTYTCF